MSVKAIHIGLVCPYDLLRSGGVQEHVLAQAAELRRRGHHVTILTPRPWPHKSDEALEGVIFVGNSTNIKTPIKTSLELGIYSDRGLKNILDEANFDLLHVHEPEVPVLGAQIIANATCPIVATFHAVYPDTAMARTLETLRVPYAKSIFSKLTAITAVSDAAAGFVREYATQPVQIIPNGIDLKKYKCDPSVDNKGNKTILYIGRLEKRKGVLYLLKAFAKLRERRDDVQLLIAGSGELEEQLRSYTENHDIPDVSFLGFVAESEKLQLLSQADLFCSPALYGESFGIVLLEAMACGIVTVAGDNVGYSSVMQETGRISLVNPKHTDDFTQRLELLLDDVSVRKLWQQWAKQYVKQFDYPNVVDKYEALYQEVLA